MSGKPNSKAITLFFKQYLSIEGSDYITGLEENSPRTITKILSA